MISARGISKRFGALRVLDRVDLDIAAGEVTAIVGPNGSGKTTFNKIMLGLVRADAGTLHLNGVLLTGNPAYRAQLGYMPQIGRYPENLCADDVVRLLERIRGQDGTDRELFETLALGSAMNTPLRLLSGGTRQRVNAALAFLFRPDLLVLDEPTAGLDPVSSATLKDKILRERARGCACVITSHVLSELDEIADRVAFLLDGSVRFYGAPGTLKRETAQPTLERAIAFLMRKGTIVAEDGAAA